MQIFTFVCIEPNKVVQCHNLNMKLHPKPVNISPIVHAHINVNSLQNITIKYVNLYHIDKNQVHNNDRRVNLITFFKNYISFKIDNIIIELCCVQHFLSVCPAFCVSGFLDGYVPLCCVQHFLSVCPAFCVSGFLDGYHVPLCCVQHFLSVCPAFCVSGFLDGYVPLVVISLINSCSVDPEGDTTSTNVRGILCSTKIISTVHTSHRCGFTDACIMTSSMSTV